MSLRKWFKNNDSLNWMPEKRQERLIDEIKRQEHFAEFEALMLRIERKENVSAYEILETAITIALHSDLDVPKDKAVYFSGTTQQLAESFVAAHDDYQVIHSRPAGAMLELLGLFSEGNDLTSEEAYQPWYMLAARYARASQGNVTAFLDQPLPNKTFRSVELHILMNNSDVTHINHMEKTNFSHLITGERSSFATHFRKAVRMLIAREPKAGGPRPS